MDPYTLQKHLHMLYLRGDSCDTTVVLSRRDTHVAVNLHKVKVVGVTHVGDYTTPLSVALQIVLSQAGFFAALFSQRWASGGDPRGSSVEICVDIEGTAIEAAAFEDLVDFLYGVLPRSLSSDDVKPLLAVGTYFDVPQLCSLVSEFAIETMSFSTCALYSSLKQVELGEFGQRLADASVSFLLRNAVDNAEVLASADLTTQVRLGSAARTCSRVARSPPPPLSVLPS